MREESKSYSISIPIFNFDILRKMIQESESVEPIYKMKLT